MPTVTEKPSQTNTGSSAAGPSSSNQEAPISSASNAPVEQLNLDVDSEGSDDTASPVRRTPKKKPPVRPSSGVESILSHRRLGSQSMPFPLPSTPPSFARGVRALPRSAQPAQPSDFSNKGKKREQSKQGSKNRSASKQPSVSRGRHSERNSPEQYGGNDGGDGDDGSGDDGSTNPDDDETPVPFRWREIPTPDYDEGPAAMIRALFQSQKDWKEHSSGEASDKNFITRPEPYDGRMGYPAKEFLAKYTTWLNHSGKPLNFKARNGRWYRFEEKWILSILSHMKGTAGKWALPYLALSAEGGDPFFGSWDGFVAGYKARFQIFSDGSDAILQLNQLWQNKTTIGEYSARFMELMSETPFSEPDLRERYYSHLNSEMQIQLAGVPDDISSLEDLMKVAGRLDQARIQVEYRQKRSSPYQTRSYEKPATISASSTPAASSIAANGNGKTREQYQEWMRGKCYGCGSTAHLKANGHHERDLCGHCGKTGHQEPVCTSKFLGYGPRSAKAAASNHKAANPETSSSNRSMEERIMAALETYNGRLDTLEKNLQSFQ